MESVILALILSMITISTEASPTIITRSPEICRLGMSIPGLIVSPSKEIYRYGETVKFSCKDGYRFNSRMPRRTTCHTTSIYNQGPYNIYADGLGAFIPGISPDICVPIFADIEGYCLYPIQEGLSFEKTKPSARIYDLGEQINLACEDDYELTVQKIATCQSDGFFSFTAIESHRNMGGKFFKHFNQICSKKPICQAPTGHGVMVSPEKHKYTSGEAVTVSCEENYELVGSNTTVCGYKIGSSISHYIRRKHGYGEFNKMVNKCRRKPTCDGLDLDLPDLVVNPLKDDYEIGEKVNVSCRDRHEQNFEFTSITCMRTNVYSANFDRSFSDEPCTLINRCKAPPPQPGRFLLPMKDEYNTSETVEIHCDEGYELRGRRKAYCAIHIFSSNICRYDLRLICPRKVMTSTVFIPQLGTCEKVAAATND